MTQPLAPPVLDASRNGRSSVRTRAAGASRRKALLVGLAGVLSLVAVLEIVSQIGIVNKAFLPPFSSVVVTTIGLFTDATFLNDLLSTIVTWALGMLISIAIAVPVGIILGLSELSYKLSRTVIELIRPMPAVALIPLVIVVAGQGIEMKLIVAVYAAIWPILFNAIYGVHGVDPVAKEMGRSFGQTPVAVIRRIVIPGAAPFIATGVRISSAIVLIVIITVEIIAGGTDGLGSFIARQRTLATDVELVYAGILVTGILGLATNLTLGALERHWFRWNSTTRN